MCWRMGEGKEKEKREKGMDAKWTRYVLPSVTLPPSDYRSDTFELFRPCAPFRLLSLCVGGIGGTGKRKEEGRCSSPEGASNEKRDEEEEEEEEEEVCPVRDLA